MIPLFEVLRQLNETASPAEQVSLRFMSNSIDREDWPAAWLGLGMAIDSGTIEAMDADEIITLVAGLPLTLREVVGSYSQPCFRLGSANTRAAFKQFAKSRSDLRIHARTP